MNFEQRIKALKAEVEALKTVKRKSSTTLNTLTKTTTCTAQLKNINGVVVCLKAGAVAINPSDSSNSFLYSVSILPYSSRQRDIRVFNWLFNDGSVGAMLVPYSSNVDNSLAVGATKNVTITVKITATCNFTTTSSQIIFDTE